MTRCDEFYEKVKKDGNFCGMSKSAYNEVLQYLEFQQETDLSALSEKAAKPLIREQDKEIREAAISTVEKTLNYHKPPGSKTKKKLTARNVKEVIVQ